MDRDRPGPRTLSTRDVVKISSSATRVRAPNPDYPPSRVMPAVMSRLLNEDWHAMTASANASPNHVSSDDRWTRQAREANPALTDDQAWRLGQKLKKAHFVKMGQLSAQARRIAREAHAELVRADGEE